MFYMIVCLCAWELIVNHFNFSIILWAITRVSGLTNPTCALASSPILYVLIDLLFICLLALLK